MSDPKENKPIEFHYEKWLVLLYVAAIIFLGTLGVIRCLNEDLLTGTFLFVIALALTLYAYPRYSIQSPPLVFTADGILAKGKLFIPWPLIKRIELDKKVFGRYVKPVMRMTLRVPLAGHSLFRLDLSELNRPPSEIIQLAKNKLH